MEKTVNNYYKAVSILCYIFASILVVTCVLGLIGINSSNELFVQMYEEYIAEGLDPAMAQALVQQVVNTVYALFIVGIISAGFTYAEGAIFGKLTIMDDKKAYEKYSFALAWVIVSFFFCGLLIAGLALAGLLAVQKKQKERYLAGEPNLANVASGVQGAQTAPVAPVAPIAPVKKEETNYSLENMEKVRERLVKLQEIKELGALTDEEFNKIRSEIMKSFAPAKAEEPVAEEAPVVNPVDEKKAKRLAKLDELKACGAVSEEEYATLKEKIDKE